MSLSDVEWNGMELERHCRFSYAGSVCHVDIMAWELNGIEVN